MQETTALLNDPMQVFGFLAGVIALVFWLSGIPRLKKLFDVLPPVLFAYFVPTLATTFGITPPTSPAYDWMRAYLLPIALLLLMITFDLRAIMRLGRVALIMMLTGTVGIIIGAPVAFLVFGPFLPENAWQGFAALSGSWIGGSANMVAIAESVGLPPADLGPFIVVDTVVGYGWMAVLLFLSSFQERFDRWNRADRTAIEETNRRLQELDTRRHPIDLRMALVIIGFAFAGAVLGIAIGDRMPPIGDPTIISNTTWAVLVVVTGGVILSFTPVRQLEEWGASRFGYAALYLLISAMGAQADLRAVLDAPLYLAAGVLWLSIHIALMFLVARLVRAPLFFLATGSMANVGGAASAPVVAGVYHPAMAPVGLLMAVAGYVLGIYGGIAVAAMLAALAGA
ncbi:MAG TPA: DUF819 family protein [Longimicrobiales bacterium]|nr:DUF819 family protein [Longimicrobiales bacterium]